VKLSEKYGKSLENKWVIRLKTVHPDGDSYDGIVMANKRLFLVIKEVREFEFDGTMILPKNVIRGYRDSDFEKCHNAVIRDNDQINKAEVPAWCHDCGSLREVFEYFKNHDIWPGVETLLDDGKTAAFCLGPITETSKRSFSLHCYDAAGRWEKVYCLDYDEVFRIEFDSKYCNHFNNYMKAHNTYKASSSQ
jgi:hypothetical protein